MFRSIRCEVAISASNPSNPSDRSPTAPSAHPQPGTGLTYKDAGVDIEAGNALIQAISPATKATARPGADGALGGFGALFDLRAAGYTDPLLVAATDGVGTKLRLALDSGLHTGVGIDLVAMCVNDLVVQGAEPLFFLDYYATGRLDVPIAAKVVRGIATGCSQAGCALIGGETAEMPGMYGDGDYDLAGFAVGAVERGAVLTGDQVGEGDAILGLPASGPHSNGYSLIRKILAKTGADLSAPPPFTHSAPTLAEALLTPTRIYVAAALALHKAGLAHAFAHITGGGFWENIPRVLPDHLAAEIDPTAWSLPPVFAWLAAAGGVAPAELARTFNCGIGMICVVPADRAEAAMGILTAAGEQPIRLGHVRARTSADAPQVSLPGLDAHWIAGGTP